MIPKKFYFYLPCMFYVLCIGVCNASSSQMHCQVESAHDIDATAAIQPQIIDDTNEQELYDEFDEELEIINSPSDATFTTFLNCHNVHFGRFFVQDASPITENSISCPTTPKLIKSSKTLSQSLCNLLKITPPNVLLRKKTI